MIFRCKKSVPVPYHRQGYIYFKSLCYRDCCSPEDQQHILNLCLETGGEYYQALFDYVTRGDSPVAVCMEHHLSQSTLERAVRKYYAAFPDWL